MRSAFAFVIAFALLACGCAGMRPWNIAHSGLELTAEAVAATDEIVAERMEPDTARAREEAVASRRECMEGAVSPDDCPVDMFMDMWRERVSRWETVVDSLEAIREILIVGEQAVTAWRDSQEQPGDWSHICARLDATQAAVRRALSSFDIDVPPAWARVADMIGPVCTFAVPILDGLTEGDSDG